MRMRSSTVIGAVLAPVYARNRKSGPSFCSAAADIVDSGGIAVPVQHGALDAAVRGNTAAAPRPAGDLALRFDRPIPPHDVLFLFLRREQNRVRLRGDG